MSCVIFGDKDFEKYFKKSVSHQYMRNVEIRTYSCGIIVNEHKHGFGVFDSNYKFVKSSRQMRKNNGQFIPKFNHKNIPYVNVDAVFVGNVFPQFGHFLLEHMNRAYAALDKKYKNMKFVLVNNKDVNPVPNYMFELLELLGVKRDNIMILNETTQFKNVYVPDQGFNIPVYSSQEFGKIYDKIAKNVPDTEVYDKIYVSRAALQSRRTFGENVVQKIFEKNGFKIIYPEKLPLTEQISLVKNCKVLAGCAGTALHLALFMKPGGTVIQIKRNRLPKCNADIQNLINDTKKLNGIFISGSVEKDKTDHCSSVPQIIGVNEYMREFFNAYKFTYFESDTKPDEQDLQEYNVALNEYNSKYGSVFINNLKHFIIHWTSCFVPGRENRGNYRRWLKRVLNYEG
jgi:hypothetical protein